MLSFALRAAVLAASVSLSETPVAAGIEYLGVGSLSGTALDRSGLTGPLLNNLTGAVEMPHNRAGGWGSAITYSGAGNRYLATPDRGPADGNSNYIDRLYEVDVTVTRSSGGTWTVTPAIVGTQLLRRGNDFFTGSSAAIASGLRFDPEGVVVSRSGRSVFVSDEYGPYVYEFDRNTGQRLRTIDVPAKFAIAHPSVDATNELPPFNMSGRQANRGMEGLAISPDGTKLYGIMQSPLIQDGALNAANGRIGVNNRLVEINLATGATREFIYQMEPTTLSGANAGQSNLGVSEILAISDTKFLVLERDGRGLGRDTANDARFKRAYMIDISGATDVSAVMSLPTLGSALPSTILPAQKSLFLDFLTATGIAPTAFPEKLEGLAWGPNLDDGRLLLLATVDNDFAENLPTRVFAFAVDVASVPGFTRQSVPEPSTVALMLVPIGLVVWRRRRSH